MYSKSSLIRQQQRAFIRVRQAKRLLHRMTVEAVTDPSLRWKWMGLLALFLLVVLLTPSPLDRVPAPLQQERDLTPDLSLSEIDMPDGVSIFDPFPFPEALEPHVAFWRDIFAIHTTEHLVIHDNWYLPVIYDVVDVSSSEYASKAEGRRAAEAAKKKYETLLTAMSRKWDKPDSMTTTERRIYDLFETYPEAGRFKKKDAKDRVRIQVGQADRVREGLIRAGRYFDAMKQILRDHDVPETFVYLPIVESGFNTQAESFVGAAGMWQFMRSTGKEYNLAINAYLDERRDPLLATAAAAKLLSYNYKHIQSWPLAITAYNHGLQGMKNAARLTGTTDIDVIMAQYDGARFGFASRNFYPEFLAAIDVGLRYTEYFGELELVPPMPLERIPLTDYVSAKTLEQHTPLTAAQIKDLNPALHSSVFNAGNFLPKNYELNVPSEQADAFRTAYAAIPNNLKLAAVTIRHTVKKGETLSTIAAKYKTSSATLARLNTISDPSKIRIGQVLRIPSSSAVAVEQASERSSPTAKTPASATAPAKTTTASAATSATTATKTHRVTKGQTLSTIAQRYGTTVTAIARLNNLSNPGSIREGQTLTIPGSSAAVVQTASAPEPPAVHRVQKGQTLSSIAKQYNTSVQALTSLNKINNPRTIKPGQLLKIPQG